jgi:hypothetical protein
LDQLAESLFGLRGKLRQRFQREPARDFHLVTGSREVDA